MKIYLVRHGESEAHEGSKRQSPNSSLGAKGKKQAQAVAKRLKKEEIDVILTSKLNRAKETALAISKKLKVKLELFDGIHEKEQNPALYGADLASEVHQRYIQEVKKYGDDFDWKFDGEGESLRDLIERTSKFQRHLLKSHKNQNVLVVTHGLFIRAFVILALLGRKYEDSAFYGIFQSISTDNTGISLLEYDFDKKHWELRYLNDHLHIR